jgi:alginate O-acetyltransferase complex protein AlgI
MLFCTRPFLLFFLTVFTVYWALPWHKARVWWLVAVSFFFYARWNEWLACVVLASALMDYLLALGMEATTVVGRRRLLLGLSLAVNLGLLVTFKYANFFLQSLQEALQSVGLEASLPVLSVLVPVGISFYTFEAINYAVEVYRGRLRAERDPGHFLLFILFFPHLVAGPIVRAGAFLPQINRPKRWNWQRVHQGAGLILLGLIKKLALADRMAAYVDPVLPVVARSSIIKKGRFLLEKWTTRHEKPRLPSLLWQEAGEGRQCQKAGRVRATLLSGEGMDA